MNNQTADTTQKPSLLSFSETDYASFIFSVAGFGLLMLHISIYYMLNNVIPSQYNIAGIGRYDFYAFFFIATFAVSACRGIYGRVNEKKILTVGVVCMAAGSLLFPLDGPVFGVLFGLLAGVGVALMLIFWGVTFSHMDRVVAVAGIAVGYLLGVILNIGVDNLTVVYEVIGIVCGPLSAFFLLRVWNVQAKTAQLNGSQIMDEPDKEKVDPNLAIRASIAMGVFAAASIFCSFAAELDVIAVSETPGTLLTVLRVVIIAVLVAIALVLLFAPNISLQSMYRIVPLLLVVSGVFYLLHQTSPLFSYLMALTGRLGFQLVFWMFSPLIAMRSKLPTDKALSLELALYWTGYLASLFTVRTVWAGHAIAHDESIGILVLVSVSAMLLAYLFLFSEHELYKATLASKLPQVTTESLDTVITKIAKYYALSQRETEVFALLARGRETAYIQQTLNISAGTVSSHRQRIYRKLGITSKGELLDVVERFMG
ncbi:MAG: hypothetical protein IKE43_08230 [Coriobacteriales bacterium]|nr:hypothetical protein [Coriobacteriales bacterium]